MKNVMYTFAAIACFLGMDAAVKKGNFVTDFQFSDELGQVRCLSQYRGKNVALIFYPNESVPYCRLEAETLRNEFAALEDAGISVIAINNESKKGRLELRNRLKIPFSLSTADKKVFKSFGVDGWFGEVKRKTFLIDKNGVLVKIIDDVKLRKHHVQILEGFGL